MHKKKSLRSRPLFLLWRSNKNDMLVLVLGQRIDHIRRNENEMREKCS